MSLPATAQVNYVIVQRPMNVACTDSAVFGRGVGNTARRHDAHTPSNPPLCCESDARAAVFHRVTTAPISTVCCFKMADGLRTGELLCVGDVIEKSAMKDCDNGENRVKNDSVNEQQCENVDIMSVACESDQLFKNLCSNNDGSKQHEGILPCEDDCRKKRCVDRYDSSESSDRFVRCLFVMLKQFQCFFHS